jgi:pilus assembly protein FimV
LAFTLDFPSVTTEATARKAVAPTDLSLGDINLNLDDLTPSASASAGSIKGENWQEVTTKLDLAKAYQEMGDAAGAKEILDEVLRDGDEKQRATAQAMLQQL